VFSVLAVLGVPLNRALRADWQISYNTGEIGSALIETGLILMYAAIAALILGLIVGLIGGLGIGSLKKIPLVEILRWHWNPSWKKMSRGLVLGLILGLIVGLISWGAVELYNHASLIGVQRSKPNPGPIAGLFGGLVFGLIFGLIDCGLTDTAQADKASPNLGIKLSLKNSLAAFLVTWLIVGLIFTLIFGSISGSVFAWLIYSVIVGLIGGLNRGGSAVIKHYALRLILWRKGYTPFKFVKFLDECARLVLLQKAGGGYIFIHRMLLDYFADIPTQHNSAKR